MFPGYQDATWTFDEEAGAWYYHRFYDFQPDLNMANPRVRQEIEKIIGLLAAARRGRVPAGRGPVRHRADDTRRRPARARTSHGWTTSARSCRGDAATP